MSSLEEELDAFVGQVARRAGLTCGQGCRCRRCRPGACSCRRCSATESGPGIRAASRQTGPDAVGTQLPAWRGWSPAVRLSAIIAARDAGPGSAAARAMSEFLARGSRVYRISRDGLDIDRPLTIGMTISNSILERVIQHHRGGGDPRVTAAIRNLPENNILVQAALLTRQGMHPRRAKSYENWLQDRERPILYNPDTITFESADNAHHFA